MLFTGLKSIVDTFTWLTLLKAALGRVNLIFLYVRYTYKRGCFLIPVFEAIEAIRY